MSTNPTAAEEQRNDAIAEDDIRRGWAVSEVPDTLKVELKEAGLKPFEHIRMTRLNPTRRRKITEVVQRAYFRDLKDSDLLSNAQVKELVETRGEWTPKHEQRLAQLQERTQSKMMTLYHEGVRRSKEWLEQIGAHRERFVEIVNESDKPDNIKEELKERFERWAAYSPKMQTEYQERYPTALVDGLYYPDRDLGWLMDNSPTLEVADLLEDVDNINLRIHNFITLVEERNEYDELRVTRLRIFANTVESRRDNAEEVARVFFCTEVCNAEGTPIGPLSTDFEKMYDLPDSVISWLVEEQFFFHNAIPRETQEMLKGFGFLSPKVETEESTTTTGPESEPQPSAE
jgi:hypothetical protein